ncbi:c-type cytochrome [Cytophaga aurantiaca]|nr:c-type cytochrome [Cytophaga aurantiaca]
MKLNLILFIVLMFLIIAFNSFTSSQIDRRITLTSVDTTKSYLTLYGQYVYNREKCFNCHSLNQTKDPKIISLDGLANKYPKSWHYWHLVDPTIVVVNSKMPSFSILSYKIFNKDSIDKIIHEISLEEWDKELAESKLINAELNSNGIEVKENSEIIALISYLDNIQESEELKLIRIKQHEETLIQNKLDDSLWARSEFLINQSINEKHSSKKGQQVFSINCTACHGRQGEGGVGPNLTDNYWLHGSSNENIANTIINGVPDKGMIGWRYELTPNEVGYLVSFLKSIKGTNPPNAKMPQGIIE